MHKIEEKKNNVNFTITAEEIEAGEVPSIGYAFEYKKQLPISTSAVL